MESSASRILDDYERILRAATDFTLIGSETHPIPEFPQAILTQLCVDSKTYMAAQPSLLKLTGEIYIVGDIHGNIRDLLRIFITTKGPGHSKYLFLGDYVDRGEYSVEVMTLLLALALKYPDNIFLLRGNHEFKDICLHYGFHTEITDIYNDDALFSHFLGVMELLPLAAVVNGTIFCVHGGISPNLHKLSDIEEIKRPPDGSQLLSDIMWSDPATTTETFSQSRRGSGRLFGVGAINNFLTENHLTKIIRAHQFIESGVQQFGNGILFTVFSSCNYRYEDSNKCGLVKVKEDGEIEAFAFDALPMLRRRDARFSGFVSIPKAKASSMTSVHAEQHIMMKRDIKTTNDTPKIRPSTFGKVLRKQTAAAGNTKRNQAGMFRPPLPVKLPAKQQSNQ